MKQVLLVTYYFPPAPMAFAQRVAKLCKYLPTETDWMPHVICGELPVDLLPGQDETLLKEIPESVSITRVGSFLGSNLASRLRALHLYKPVAFWRKLLVLPDAHGDWIKSASALSQRNFSNGRGIDVILASGPPDSVYVLGSRLSEQWQVPLVIDMRDPWHHSWGKYRKLGKWLNRRTQSIEKQIYQQAAAIITNTSGNMTILKNRFPEYADKIVMIPNGFDPDDINWERGPRLISAEDSPSTVHLLYLGGIRGGGFEEPFLRTLAAYLEEHPEERMQLRIHFVGGTKAQIDNLVLPFGLLDICVPYGVVPVNFVGRPLVEADIYVLLLPVNAHQGWIPAKFYYYLAGGKHIFALIPDGSAKKIVVQAGDLAEVSVPDDLEAGKVALTRIIERVRRGKRPQIDNGFPPYASPFDRRHIAQQVAEILDKVAR